MTKVDGARNSLSENNNPVGGPSFETPWGMTTDPGDLVVDRCADIMITDSGAERTYQVDLTTGVRTTVSDNNTSSGSPAYLWPMGIVATSLSIGPIGPIDPVDPGRPGRPGQPGQRG